MCRIFPQTVSYNIGWRLPLRLEYAPGRDRGGQDRRLRDLRQLELVLGSFEAQLRKLVAECGVGFVERLLRDGIHRSQVAAHADPLRTLPREHERDGGFVMAH